VKLDPAVCVCVFVCLCLYVAAAERAASISCQLCGDQIVRCLRRTTDTIHACAACRSGGEDILSVGGNLLMHPVKHSTSAKLNDQI